VLFALSNRHITPRSRRDLLHAASATGSLYRSPLAIIAHAIRAILLASAAHLLLVNGGAAVGELTTFSPRVRECSAAFAKNCIETSDYVLDDDFLNQLQLGKQVELKFTGTIFDLRKVLESKCSISITEDLRNKLAENEWYAARCITSHT
jgi:hypothetical protein